MKIGPGLRAAVNRELARSSLVYGGFREYLGSANVVPEGPVGPDGYSLRIEDIDRYQMFVAGDFDRFALASFESFFRSREAGSDLSYLGWRLLESYYASFFAAHALMRSLGGGVAHLGGSEVQRLSELALLYGLSDFSLQAGSVVFETSSASGNWFVSVRKSTRGSGVHDGFWRDFCAFLERTAEQAVAKGLPDATDFLSAAIELSDAILVGGSGTPSWLASVRNALNYRHEMDVWFPYRKSVNTHFQRFRIGDDAEASFRTDLSRTKDTLQLFENVNSRIVHILWGVADLFQSISKRSGHFGGRYSRIISLKS